MSNDAVTDVVRVLIRREGLLRSLLDSPQSKPDLVESLQASRSTVDRAIGELQGLNLVERSAGTYAVTSFGKIAFVEYDRLRGNLGDLLAVQDLIASLPVEADLDAAVFESATVEFTPAFGPQVIETTFGDAVRARIASPMVAILYGSAVHGHGAPETAEVEMLLDGDAIAHMEQYYPGELRAIRDRVGTGVYRAERQLPFCLALLETEEREWMSLLVPFGNDTIAVLSNDGDDAVTWAETTYEEYRQRARPYPTATT